MKTRKQIFQQRIRRIVAHRDNPHEPTDAATILHIEAMRISALKTPLAKSMSFAFRLAAAKLEAWGDPAMETQYRRVKP